MTDSGHKELLESLLNGEILGYNSTRKIFDTYVLGPKANDVLIAAFVTAYCMRKPTATEMTAIVDSVRANGVNSELQMLFNCIPLPFNVITEALKSIRTFIDEAGVVPVIEYGKIISITLTNQGSGYNEKSNE